MARKQSSKRTGSRVVGGGSISFSRDLIWIDMEPLLVTERTKCRKASEKLIVLKKQIDEFREHDEPAYAQWFYSKFGQELTACREMDQRYEERASLIRDVRIEAMRRECSEREAYERVMDRRTRAERSHLADETDAFSAEDFDDQASEISDLSAKIRQMKLDPTEENDLRDQFEQQMGDSTGWEIEYESLFREYVIEYKKFMIIEAEKTNRRRAREDSADEATSDGDQRGRGENQERGRGDADDEEFVPRQQAPAHPEADQIKSLYRILARRLHPDANPNLTPAERALWYDVQAAYESADLMRLESILAMIDQDGSETGESGGKRGLESVRSVSRLRLIFKDFEKKLRTLRKQLRSVEQSVAWEFRAILKDPKRLRIRTSEIQRDLRYDFEEMHSAVMEMDELVETWSRARPRSRGRRR